MVRLPKKFQHALKAFVESALLLILVLMIYQTLSYGMRLYERGTTTSDLLLPIYPFLYCIAFAALIFSLLVLSNICKSIRQAVSSS
ncbi:MULTISPECIES: TRAP transporter small permease subunit [unclassified Shouchella]|uniref:TRAP transporter small permease subunit n=1 Tax=unclassified Shouchella TaxID=2893065 RepID=UPI0039A310D9